ncbi:Allergen Asp f 7-like protein [Colletotrichum spinosum]|uniref:Allergen Asp f 7-like protein n=1 Tax=Colletotrichum spinosum TaxID=1347390 RepID=A0A4R8QNF3_9PEZI|nr:Allergen Asp f 7-like protein [Colletotrichum spinosum]
MKTSAILCAVLATAAIAQPHQHGNNKRRHVHGKHQKRALVTEWVTETAYVTEYIDATTTVWVGPEDPATPSAAVPTTSVPAQFFEPAEQPSSTTLSTTLSTSTTAAAVPVVVQESIQQAPALKPSTSTSTPPPAPQTPTPEPVVQETPAPVYVPPPAPTTTTTPQVQPRPTAPAAAPAVSAAYSSGTGTGTGGGSGSGKAFTGDSTYYALGLSACGDDYSGQDKTANVVAISKNRMGASSTGRTGCNEKIKISKGDKSLIATIVDKCMGCDSDDVDVSEKIFLELFGDLGVGRGTVEWSFV